MLELTIPAMTCNHCVVTLTKAIREIDNKAELEFNLEEHQLTVETTQSAKAIKEAIENSGYEVETSRKVVPAKSGNCCGSCRI